MRFLGLVLLLAVAAVAAVEAAPTWEVPWWDGSWTYRVPVTVANVVDADYEGFPIEVVLSDIPAGHMLFPSEVRVLWFNGSGWVAVPSQAYGEERHGDGSIRSVRVLFLADVPAGGSRTYYVYYGNPMAVPVEYNKQFRWWTRSAGRDKYLYLENSLVRIGVRKTGIAGIVSAWVVGGSGVDLIGDGTERHWFYSHFYEGSWHENGEIVEDGLIPGPVALIYRYVVDDGDALRYETWLYMFADKNFVKAVVRVEHVKDKPVFNASWCKPSFECRMIQYSYNRVENATTYVQLYSTQLREGVAMVLDNNPPYAPSRIRYGPWKGGVSIVGDWGPGVTLLPRRSLLLCRYLVVYRGGDPRYVEAGDLDRLVAYPPIIEVGSEKGLPGASYGLVKIGFEEAREVVRGGEARIKLAIKIENRGLRQGKPLMLNVYVFNSTFRVTGRAVDMKAPSGVFTKKIELPVKPGEYIVRAVAMYPGGWSNLIEAAVSPEEAVEEGGLPYALLAAGGLAVTVALAIAIVFLRRRR